MKTITSYTMSEPTEAEIQKQAYYLWLESGQPEGHNLEHWDAAREVLRHRAKPHDEDIRRKVVPAPTPAKAKFNARQSATARELSARGMASN